MTLGTTLLVAALLAPPEGGRVVVSVRVEEGTGGGASVIVRLAEDGVPATVRREGARLLIEVTGQTSEPPALPRPAPPVVAVGFEEARPGVSRLAVEVAPPFEYEVQRSGPELRLRIAARPAADDVETLAEMLFPAAGAGVAPSSGEPPSEPGGARVRLEPRVSASYASGLNGFEEGPQPSEDSYWELVPAIDAVGGPLRLGYEAHLRGGSRYPAVNSTITHLLEALLEGQLASDTHVSGRYEFLRGRQQASAVDPGGEYFYGFEPFRKHTVGAQALVPLGGATGLVVSGTWAQLGFEEPGTFLDYSSWSAQGGLRREIGGQTSLELLYTREEVYDSSDTNVAGSSAGTISLSLNGEVRPMLRVLVLAALGQRHSPGAPAAAQDATDLLARVNVRREFSDNTALELGYTRSRNVSAFESNPSYRSDLLEARGYAPLPLELSLAASVGFRQNGYPLDALGIGAPRQDRIFGWSLGLGRSLGGWLVAHAEYQWLRRRSNLPGYSSASHALLVQVDVTPWREGARP